MAAHDPLQPHSHDPNPEPPSQDPSFELTFPNGRAETIGLDYLMSLPKTAVENCFIVSTGHGTSGPFTFEGVRLIDLIQAKWTDVFSEVEVVSADGFGNRVMADEIEDETVDRPIILAFAIDGKPMSRAAGVLRMVVPSEIDDALRQVKWIGKIQIR